MSDNSALLNQLQQLRSQDQSNLELAHLIARFTTSINQAVGTSLKPWTPQSLLKLQNMPQEACKMIQGQIQFYMDLANSSDIEIGEDGEMTEVEMEQKLLEVCSKKLGIVFNPEVYDRLTQDKIIEIYNQDMIQIYRSLSFFNLCSYSLSELLTNEFYELYERSLQVNSLLMESAQKLINREYSLAPISLKHIPQHVMREKFSEEKTAFFVQFEEAYPIYTWSREFYGYLLVLKADRASQTESNIAFI